MRTDLKQIVVCPVHVVLIIRMTLGCFLAPFLLCILSVHSEIYVYRNSLFNRIAEFKDVLSKSGPLPSGWPGFLRRGVPADGCSTLLPADKEGLFVILARSGCSYESKVRNAQKAHYSAVIVHNVGSNSLISMPYENNSGIRIPAVFVSEDSGRELLHQAEIPATFVTINEFQINKDVLVAFMMFLLSMLLFLLIAICFICVRNRYRDRSILRSLPRHKYNKDLNYETCVICQDIFQLREYLRILPCSHAFHVKCIDAWLMEWHKRECPVCKRLILGEEKSEEQTPLLRKQQTVRPLFDPEAGSSSQSNVIHDAGHSVNTILYQHEHEDNDHVPED